MFGDIRLNLAIYDFKAQLKLYLKFRRFRRDHGPIGHFAVMETVLRANFHCQAFWRRPRAWRSSRPPGARTYKG